MRSVRCKWKSDPTGPWGEFTSFFCNVPQSWSKQQKWAERYFLSSQWPKRSYIKTNPWQHLTGYLFVFLEPVVVQVMLLQCTELSTRNAGVMGYTWAWEIWLHQATKKSGRDLREEHSEQKKQTLSYVQDRAGLSDKVQQKCVVKAVSKLTDGFRDPEACYSCCHSFGWMSFIFNLKHQSGNKSQKCTGMLTLLM